MITLAIGMGFFFLGSAERHRVQRLQRLAGRGGTTLVRLADSR